MNTDEPPKYGVANDQLPGYSAPVSDHSDSEHEDLYHKNDNNNVTSGGENNNNNNNNNEDDIPVPYAQVTPQAPIGTQPVVIQQPIQQSSNSQISYPNISQPQQVPVQQLQQSYPIQQQGGSQQVKTVVVNGQVYAVVQPQQAQQQFAQVTPGAAPIAASTYNTGGEGMATKPIQPMQPMQMHVQPPIQAQLPPGFPTTGNGAVDYLLARERCCCCSLRAGILVLAAYLIIYYILVAVTWGDLGSEDWYIILIVILSIIAGIIGWYGGYNYHKLSCRIFYYFFVFDTIYDFILLIYSIYMLNSGYCDDYECDYYYSYRDEDYCTDICESTYTIAIYSYIWELLWDIYFIWVTRKFYNIVRQI